MKETKHSKESTYFRFSSFGFRAFADRSIARIRARVFELFRRSFPTNDQDLILDVGVSAEDHATSNFFEKLYPYKENITAVGMGNFSSLETIYPGLRFVQADGRNLPFADNSFDVIFSHAVLEHAGARLHQMQFIRELIRVSKRGVYFTTPNRLHPIEFHTGFPLLHYLPQNLSRELYRLLRKEFYANEENLNLLSKRDIKKMLSELKVTDFRIQNTFWLGLPANILVTIYKHN